jgi:thioesterase domain-containing protein/acyl carrier protein
VGPRTPIEKALARLWAEVLRLSEVGVDDDYFALGGTSLAAVTLFARIERELGARLPLAALVETPTIAGLAKRIELPRGVESLVPLFAKGQGVPLFLVHDADGETLLYRNLALRLADRPVYGVQASRLSDAALAHTRISEMAAQYVAEVRKVCPSGPYLLGGLCAGGVLAYEMARQLEDMGEQARLVALFDAADVEAQFKPHLESVRRIARVRRVLREVPPAKAARVVCGKLVHFTLYQLGKKTESLWGRLEVAALRYCRDRGLTPPPWAKRISVRLIYTAAEAEFRPLRPLHEEIVLFRASEGEGSEEPNVNRYTDPVLGWGKRSVRGVHAFDVPGGHGGMLQEPQVEILAEILRSRLAVFDGPAIPSAAVGGPA